jgi:hypothetical protein
MSSIFIARRFFLIPWEIRWLHSFQIIHVMAAYCTCPEVQQITPLASCADSWFTCTIVLMASLAKDCVVGQELNKWSVCSSMCVLHMIHSVIDGHPFLRRFCVVCILLCNIGHRSIVILGGRCSGHIF